MIFPRGFAFPVPPRPAGRASGACCVPCGVRWIDGFRFRFRARGRRADRADVAVFLFAILRWLALDVYRRSLHTTVNRRIAVASLERRARVGRRRAPGRRPTATPTRDVTRDGPAGRRARGRPRCQTPKPQSLLPKSEFGPSPQTHRTGCGSVEVVCISSKHVLVMAITSAGLV